MSLGQGTPACQDGGRGSYAATVPGLGLTRRDILSNQRHMLGYERGKTPFGGDPRTEAVADVDNVNIRMEVPKP